MYSTTGVDDMKRETVHDLFIRDGLSSTEVYFADEVDARDKKLLEAIADWCNEKGISFRASGDLGSRLDELLKGGE
jgi:hypothetical protein